MTPATDDPNLVTTTPAPAPATPRPDGLREQAARQRRRQNRLAVALLAVLAVGALAVYLPQRRAIERTRGQLAQIEVEVAANRERTATMPQLEAAVGALRRQVDQFKPLRGRGDIERAMHEISAINTSTQLTNYKYDMDVERAHAMCREQPLKITFQADFVDAMSFIGKLEAMDRLTRLRELSITKSDGLKGGTVNVSMSLSLFFSTAVDAARATATAAADARGAR